MKKFKDYCKRVTALFLVGATVLTSGCGQSLMDGLYADELSTELVEGVSDGTEDTDSADGVAEGTETDSVVVWAI